MLNCLRAGGEKVVFADWKGEGRRGRDFCDRFRGSAERRFPCRVFLSVLQ